MMAVLMTRTEQQSSLRSEISVASSGFALVTGSKVNRKPIPPFTPAKPITGSPVEPTPDYDDDSVNGDDHAAPTHHHMLLSEKTSNMQSSSCSVQSGVGRRNVNVSFTNGGHRQTAGHVTGFPTKKPNKPEVHNANHCLQPCTSRRLNDTVDCSKRSLLGSVSSTGESSAASKQTLLKINPSTQEITVEMSQLSPNSSTNESEFHLLPQKKVDCLNDRCPYTKKRCSKCTKREKILCGTVLILLLAVVVMGILLGLSGTCAVKILSACRK